MLMASGRIEQTLDTGSLWVPALGFDDEAVLVGYYDPAHRKDIYGVIDAQQIYAVRGEFVMIVSATTESDNSGTWYSVTFYLGERLFMDWNLQPAHWHRCFERIK